VTDDLSALIRRVQADRPELTQSEIARRIGVHVSTVSTWVLRRSRGSNRETLKKLAMVLGVPERDVFAAAGRRLPGPTSADREQRILEYFRSMTTEQQEVVEIGMRALYQHNKSTEEA
jgi:transcriptional regulator with XRE-family HTH domain